MANFLDHPVYFDGDSLRVI